MPSQTIQQRIQFVVEGLNSLKEMGATGSASIRQIQSAVKESVSSLQAIESPIGRLWSVMGDASAAAGLLGSGLHRTGQGARSAVSHLKEVTTGSEEVGHVVGHAIQGVNRFTHSFGDLRGVLGALGPYLQDFVAAGIGATFLLAAHSAATAIREIVNQAKDLGLTTEQFEGLRYAALRTGVDVEKLSTLMERFTARAGQARIAQANFAQSAAVRADEDAARQQKFADDEQKRAANIARIRREQVQAAIDGPRQVAAANARLWEEQSKRETEQQKTRQAGPLSLIGAGDPANVAAHKEALQQEQANKGVYEAQTALQDKVNSSTEKEIQLTQSLTDAERSHNESVTAFNVAQERSALAASKVTDVFSLLKVSLTDAAGKVKDNYTLFLDTIDALNNTKSAQDRAAASLLLFGRSWQEVGPLIREGGAGLRALAAQWSATGLGITKADEKMAQDFNVAWGSMLGVLEAAKDKIGVVVGEIFVPLIDAIRKFVIAAVPDIQEFTSALTSILLPEMHAVIGVASLLLTTFQMTFDTIKTAFSGVAVVINGIFGTNLTGMGLIVSLVAAVTEVVTFSTTVAILARGWGLLTTVFVGSLGPLKLLYNAIFDIGIAIRTVGFASVLTPMGLLLTAAVGLTAGYLYLTEAMEKNSGSWHGWVNWLYGGLNSIIDLVRLISVGFLLMANDLYTATDGIVGISKATLDAQVQIIAGWGRVGSAAKKAAESYSGGATSPAFVKQAEGDAAAAAAQNAPQPARDWQLGGGNSPAQQPATANTYGGSSEETVYYQRATGGWIPGSGRGDHVPVLAEPGEFMVKRTVASQFGSFLTALNGGLIRGFSLGGFIDSLPTPVRMAEGGFVPAHAGGGGVPVHLHLEGKSFQMHAPQHVAEALVQHARTSAIVSGGRAPSRTGSG